jgi:multimeric flavodoxin WrbA
MIRLFNPYVKGFKSMNIVALYGSPRKKGNSAVLADRFLEKAGEMGAESRRFFLNAMTFKGCQACMGCKTRKDHCIVKDDLADILEAVRDSDVLVLATPVYFGDISAQMKAFIDRTYSYLVPDFITNPEPSRLKPGKRLVFIQAQAQPDPGLFGDIYPKYEMFLNLMGFKDNILIRACGVGDAGEVLGTPALMAEADAAAAAVMNG